MESQRVFLTAATLLLCLSAPFAVATPNHSLQWGAEINEQFTYALQRKLGNTTLINWFNNSLSFVSAMDEGQKAIVTIRGLQQIPERINSTNDVPNSFCSLVRQNDSAQLVSNTTLFVVPVGDWIFLTDMSGFLATGWTIINTESEWGATLSLNLEDGETIAYYQELRYEKQNGTLNYLRVRLSTFWTDLLDIVLVQWHAGMPTALAPELQMTTLLSILVGVAAAVMVAIVVFRNVRGKRSIVRRLGE